VAVKNSDSVPSEFFPGIASAGQEPRGDADTRTPPPDGTVPAGDSGIPNTGTPMPLADQAGAGHSASTTQPGQMDGSATMAADPAWTNSGAGEGHTDAWSRKPGQSRPGRPG
jgi:hypothetical protein